MPENLEKQDVNTKKRGLPKEAEPFMWKPGQSGNPNGRPRGTGVTDRIHQWMQAKADDTGRTGAEVFADKVLDLARNGDFRFVKEILDRYEGPVVQKVESLNANLNIEANSEQCDRLLGDLDKFTGEE